MTEQTGNAPVRGVPAAVPAGAVVTDGTGRYGVTAGTSATGNPLVSWLPEPSESLSPLTILS